MATSISSYTHTDVGRTNESDISAGKKAKASHINAELDNIISNIEDDLAAGVETLVGEAQGLSGDVGDLETDLGKAATGVGTKYNTTSTATMNSAQFFSFSSASQYSVYHDSYTSASGNVSFTGQPTAYWGKRIFCNNPYGTHVEFASAYISSNVATGGLYSPATNYYITILPGESMDVFSVLENSSYKWAWIVNRLNAAEHHAASTASADAGIALCANGTKLWQLITDGTATGAFVGALPELATNAAYAAHGREFTIINADPDHACTITRAGTDTIFGAGATGGTTYSLPALKVCKLVADSNNGVWYITSEADT